MARRASRFAEGEVMTLPALAEYESLAADALVDRILAESAAASEKALPCITCSFQAEDMIVLHMLRKRLPEIPVLFLDTGYHFAETYTYRDKMVTDWKLKLENLAAKQSVAGQEAQFGILNRTDPAKCCELRKVEPLFGALEQYEGGLRGVGRDAAP